MIGNIKLFDDFDGAVRTLHLACSADEAFVKILNRTFLALNFEDFYGTGVDACSASITFFCVDFNFNHEA